MLWCRLKHVLASVCLASFLVCGPVRAYEIPDGVTPDRVFIGRIYRDDYKGATGFPGIEYQDIYAQQLDQYGVFAIPDGYVFIDASAAMYLAAVTAPEFIARLGTWSDADEAAVTELVVGTIDKFDVGPGQFDATNLTYLDMTPIYDAAVAGAPSSSSFVVGMFLRSDPVLLSGDTFNAYVDLVIQAGADLYGLQPDDPGLLSILESLPAFDSPGANSAPTADAGAAQTVASGASVTLDGSGSSDPDTGDTLSYAWTQTSGTTVSLTGATTAAPSFTAPEIGANDPVAELVFSLVVTDDKGNASTSDIVTITVEPPANTGPTADAGADRTVPHYGGLVTLDGSGSSDPDAGDTLSYLWTQTSGAVVKVIGAGTVTPKFSAPVLGANDPAVELVFSLVVTDDKGNASTADTVTITVEPPANTGPTADAGADQTVASGAAVTLDGSGSSDPDTGDTLSYAWTQTSGTTVSLTGATTAAPGFTAPEIGANDPAAELVFSLVVTDDKGNASTADTVTITVEPPANTGPTADAGADQTVASGAAVTLDGSGSSDPDAGDTLSYAWTQTSGTTMSLTGATTAAPGFTAPEIGANDPAVELVFSLVVTDDKENASTADTVTITVEPPANTGPTADAGGAQTVASGASVTLDGSGSSDPDAGDTLSYAWTQTSGTTVSMTGATTAAPGFTAPEIGANDPAVELVFSLVVTDDKGNVSDADTVMITVSPAEQTPASEFGLYEAEIRNTITGLGLAGINSTISSNERMMRGARERLLRTQVGQIRDVPFRINPNLTQTETTLSSSGTFYGQWGGENGQRLVFGDFVLRHDEQTGTTTATLTWRAAWERMVSDRTLLGAFVGGEFAQSDLIAPREGTHRRFGLTVGGYGVHELLDGLFADGFVTVGAGRNNLEMAIGELDLDGGYMTRTLTFGGALSGVIDRGAYQVLPELAFSYGRVRFGEVGFTGRAFGLTDDTLRMQVGEVSLANITFTPEIRFTADGSPVVQSRSVFSLAPRLTCQQFRTAIGVEDCGGGLEIGFTGRSEDGLSTFTARAGADRISGRTATTLQLGVNVRF